jgi:uncharacterized PurR-regulated membrane protein YhhQ (DUF165 family)
MGRGPDDCGSARHLEQPIAPLIFGSMLLKWAIAAVDTPFVYWGVRWIDNALDGKTRAYQAG